MKKLLYLIPLIISACGQLSNDTKATINAETITFQKVNGKAIVIGEKVNILNKTLQTKTTLKGNSIVEIVGVSDSLFQKTEDYCDAFRYVKIKDENGLIDGRKVYKLTGSEQDTSFNFKDNTFHLTATTFFGIGVSDEDGITFCSKYFEPIAITNSKLNQTRFIKLIENELSLKVAWSDNCEYLELMANDGAYDKVIKIEESKKGVILTIEREFQEGYNEYQVELNLTEETYTAEYLSYGEIKYKKR